MNHPVQLILTTRASLTQDKLLEIKIVKLERPVLVTNRFEEATDSRVTKSHGSGGKLIHDGSVKLLIVGSTSIKIDAKLINSVLTKKSWKILIEDNVLNLCSNNSSCFFIDDVVSFFDRLSSQLILEFVCKNVSNPMIRNIGG